mgnify:CR=1 FL=1
MTLLSFWATAAIKINELISMKTTPKTRNPRLLVIAGIPLALFVVYAAGAYYQLHSKNVEFEERIQGMTGYEVCQVAYEVFGIDMAKDVGCLDSIEAITDIGE